MVLTDATLRNTFYTTVYNLINAASSTYLATSTVDVRGGFPDTDSIEFPIITIGPIDIDEDEYTIDTTRGTSTKSISFDATLFALSNKDVDKLADGVTNTLRTNPFDGAMIVSVGEMNNVIFGNDNKVKSKTLTFNYIRR